MSFFTSIVKNVKEFYSEINGATLTGAIDVIVVEQEDGTFKSSPFHVRFGKMGVLKAKEKIVDLEINGEPVEIQMKLDDTGAAFFVEYVECSDECLLAEQATSPIPDQMEFIWKEKRVGKLEPKTLFNEPESRNVEGVNEILDEVIECSHIMNDPIEESLEADIMKGKLNKKKKKRQIQPRFSKNGSKSSLGENILGIDNIADCCDDMFDMDDVNAADLLDDEVERQENGSSNLSKKCFEPVSYTSGTNKYNQEHVLGNNLSTSQGHISEPDASEELYLEAQPEICRPISVGSGFHYFPELAGTMGQTLSEPPSLNWEPEEQKDSEEENVWRWGELPKVVDNKTVVGELKQNNTIIELIDQTKECKNQSWFGSWSAQSKSEEETLGVYLDDIEDNSDLLAIYLGPIKTEHADPLEITHIHRNEETGRGDLNDVPKAKSLSENECHESPLPISSQAVRDSKVVKRLDSGCEIDPAYRHCDSELSTLLSRYLPDLAASLCGGLSDASITPQQFESKILDYSQFLAKLSVGPHILLADPNLVLRVHQKYLSWEKAAPILFSVMFFQQPLTCEAISKITKDCLNVNVSMSPEDVSQIKMEDKKSSSWFGWFATESKQEDYIKDENMNLFINEKKETEVNTHKTRLDTESNSTSSEDSDTIGNKKMFLKTLRLSSERLAELGLKPGSNEIEFSVTTAFQGTTRCKCHIYLWHHSDQVVISDIDGTITKSDVLGHILPVIGRDWAQSGVAQLFTKIRNNGYHIMYLSARAIGQSSSTKDYLQSVKQGDVCLPDGPIFLNPDSLIHAFKREVIDRNPEEFKIRCLKDIQNLFEEKNPFFAGYGNRPNDAFAYRAVGIPVSRIFTINPAGELRHELTQNFQTSYESQSSEVDYYFPNLLAVQQIQEQMKSNPRKQSIYFDASDYIMMKEKLNISETTEHLSDSEDHVRPFRLRSGTDISDSLNAARYKLKLKKNAGRNKPDTSVIELLQEKEINTFPRKVSLDEFIVPNEYPDDLFGGQKKKAPPKINFL